MSWSEVLIEALRDEEKQRKIEGLEPLTPDQIKELTKIAVCRHPMKYIVHTKVDYDRKIGHRCSLCDSVIPPLFDRGRK